jgi:predicted nucleotidyltransferase
MASADSASPLPIFRSKTQERLLAELFVAGEGDPISLTALSARIGAAVSSVQREVAALDRAGLVLSQRVGSVRLVVSNPASPYYLELRGLLTKAFGPAHLLTVALRSVEGVEHAAIFGSWARRYHGEGGPAPRDLDVLVVGSADLEEIYRATRSVENALRMEVNPVVISADEWRHPSGLVRRIRNDQVVGLELGGGAADDR